MWFDNHWRACVFSYMVFAMWKSVFTFTVRLLDCHSGRTAYLARFRSILRIQVGLSALGRGELPSTSCLPTGFAWLPRQSEIDLKKQIGEFPHFQCSRKNNHQDFIHIDCDLWCPSQLFSISQILAGKETWARERSVMHQRFPMNLWTFSLQMLFLTIWVWRAQTNPKIWASRTKCTYVAVYICFHG